MRKVCEVYLVSSSATDERGVELTFPASQYEMMDAFEQIHTKSPGDVYWQVDEFYCFDYLAPHLDESNVADMTFASHNRTNSEVDKICPVSTLMPKRSAANRGYFLYRSLAISSVPIKVSRVLRSSQY